MSEEYYPKQYELNLIKKWEITDVFNLLLFIEERWWCPDWGIIKKWGKDNIHKEYPVLYYELHTGGWSGNEDIINALLENQMFKMLWYSQWRRGGHFYFEIMPYSIGFKSANLITKELNITRQAVHKSNDFERLKISERNILFRKKIKT